MSLSKLLGRLSENKQKKIRIQCHNDPDADTIASGFALYSYLKEQGNSPELVYVGKEKIRKPNLNLMIGQCGISALRYIRADETEKEEEADLLITVDCQPGEGNVAPLKGKKVAAIDHHSVSVPKRKMPLDMALSRFRSYDSCVAILWELLQEAEFQPDKKLATALYYGLYMDTTYFKRLRHPVDQRMMGDLGTTKIDHEIFNRLKACNFTPKEICTLGKALSNISFNFEFRSAMAEAPDCDPNLLGAISDQMMETEGIDVCLAYCLKEDGVKLSARSYEPKILASRLVGQIALGLGTSGGTEDKAGGFLPLKNLQDACPGTSGEKQNQTVGRLISLRLADCLAQGKAGEEEPWRAPEEGWAVQELARKAEDGDVIAQYYLGSCYHYGQGIDKNLEEAFRWYLKAAERDMWEELKEEAAHQGERNPIKKQEWEVHREQALKAWAAAQRMVGRCISQNWKAARESLEGTERNAVEWYQKAAENGDDHGRLNLARHYAKGKDGELAAEWLHRAAGQGYSWAQKTLADCYAGMEEDLKSCFREDWALAAYWYELAAKKGNDEAMKKLADCYAQGRGVPADPEKADQWRRNASILT